MTTKTLIKDILLTTSGVAAFALVALSPVLAYAAEVSPRNDTMAVQAFDGHADMQGRLKQITSGDVSISQLNPQ